MILIAYGTRPEIIKLFPVVRELQRTGTPFKTLFTGQQTDLYEDVRDLVPSADYSFASHFSGEKRHNTLAESFIKVCSAAEELFKEQHFDFVVVQGDTTTALATAQTGFYNRVRVAHVEAGLRTFDLENPFPEEANRAVISQLATVNFVPTRGARENLDRVGARNVHLVGNTIVDAVEIIKREHGIGDIARSNAVLVTLHRRENHAIMGSLFNELNRVALEYPDFELVLPIHPNPNVQRHRGHLTAPNIHVIEPVGYLEMLRMIASAPFIITDSGGLQEEASCFNKKVLIVRETTERPEIVDVGLGRLVGKDILSNIEWARIAPEVLATSPFGDGHASERIVRILVGDETRGN
ncbi:MAG: non-hydrolyzing UDP-N-acetylglucosamine 2-epimerase [Thermodesulfobacteriota bacterium]